VSWLWVEYTCR